MTIEKQLYKSFGAILLTLVALLVVDIGAILKARSANAEVTATLESVRAAEAVRDQIMKNRLNLNNFLLSGDPRDEDKVNHGLTALSDVIKRGQSSTSNDFLRSALIQVESTEASWADNFAKPLLAKRHQVDAGDATVSDLQIFYLQKDPASWLAKSSAVLDQANSDVSRSLDDTQKTAKTASTIGFILVILGTIFAIAFGLVDRLPHRGLHHRASAAPHHRRPGNRRFRRSRPEH